VPREASAISPVRLVTHPRHLFPVSCVSPLSTVTARNRAYVGGGNVQPGSVRAVEYEILSSNQADSIGLTPSKLRNELGGLSQLGVLRCVDHQSRKLTVIGDARHVRKLIANGQASDPDGLNLNKQVFPVVMAGWRTSK
jgi:hypothetical protein